MIEMLMVYLEYLENRLDEAENLLPFNVNREGNPFWEEWHSLLVLRGEMVSPHVYFEGIDCTKTGWWLFNRED